MLSGVLRWLFAVVGGVAGYRLGGLLAAIVLVPGLAPGTLAQRLVLPLGLALAGALVCAGLARGAEAVLVAMTGRLHRMPAGDLVWGAVGMVTALLIAFLVTLPIPRDLPVVGDLIPLLVTVAAAYVGVVVGVRKRDELSHLLGRLRRSGEGAQPSEAAGEGRGAAQPAGRPALLDTSAIIDGRIADVCRTGFLEGTLVVASFVIEELQRIADSSDPLRRNRGRRGLDILQRLQKEPGVRLEIVEADGRGDVDLRLVKLAQQMGARVVTSDFNLNKVASLHGVGVLNVNELANALKPVVLPGEEMTVQLIRDGKEQGQGVGYLDDGTMIVVDGGRRYIGETVDVTVTSVLQTAAGRLIFARPKHDGRAAHP